MMRAAAWIVALLPLTPPQSQEIPVFRASVDVVSVDVFVHRNGKAVRGLAAEDFEVYDNGVLRDVEIVPRELVSTSAILLFDTSESVRGDKLSNLKEAATSFLAGLDDGDEAALLTFSADIEEKCALTTDRTSLHRTMEGIEAQGGTALLDALYSGTKTAEGLERPVILLFTDGRDTYSWLTEEAILETVKESNAVIYAVSTAAKDDVEAARTLDAMTRVTQGGGRTAPLKTGSHGRALEVVFLEEITAISGGRFVRMESPSKLEKHFADVLEEMKNRYLLTFPPSGEGQEGWHTLEVKVKKGRAEIRARSGYYRGATDEN